MRRLLLLLLALGWLGLDTALAQPGTTASVAGRLRRLVCRGKAGIDLRVHRDPSPGDPAGKYVMMVLTYTPSASEGADFSGLQQGECGWNPFNSPDEPPEPGRLYFDLPREAQPWSALETRAMDTTIKAGAFLPDPISLPRYLGDSRHYYSFYVDDVNYFSASFGAYGESQAVPTYVTISGPIGPAETADSRLELRCRGGSGLGFIAGGSAGTNLVSMALAYRVSAAVPGDAGRGLDPGSCAWVDRAGKPREPGRVEFTTAGNAQLHQIQSGSPVDRSATAAERYPDANTIPPYMTDPAHYWSFSVTLGSPATARAHAAWKPAIIDIVTAGRPMGQNTTRAGVEPLGNKRVGDASPVLAGSRPPPRVLEIVRRVGETWIRFSARAGSRPMVYYGTQPAVREADGVLHMQGATSALVRLNSTRAFTSEFSTAPLKGLPPGTKYYFAITVPHETSPSGSKWESIGGDFTTMVQSIVVRFTEITILNDSDKGSSGDLSFQFNLNQVVYKNCQAVDCESVFYGRSWETYSTHPLANVLRMSNAPDRVRIWVKGWDDDSQSGRWSSGLPPDGRGYASTGGSSNDADWNTAKGEFAIGINPTQTRFVIPFNLRSIDGYVLMFRVRGEIEVTRQ